MNISTIRAITQGASVVSLVVCFGTAGKPVIAQQASSPIWQQVHDTGVFERIVVTAYHPLQVADLVARADLIVEASTRGGRSYLNAAGTDIYTDYTFNVHSLLKSRRRPELRAGSAMTVRRESGEVIVEGRPAVSYENEFPAFNANEHYILFLTQQPHENVYSVFGGPQGAFSVGELVTALAVPTKDGASAPEPVSRAAFMDEVRALLKFSLN
jgi:hypothetical protein